MDCFRILNDALVVKAKNPRQLVLLGDARQRSKSFTEGKTTKAPPPPSGIPQLHLPPQGWRSNPATPREAQRDVRVDITKRQHHHPRQREIAESGDAELCDPPSGEFSDLGGDVYDNDVSSSASRERGEVAQQHRPTNISYDGQEKLIFLSELNGNHTASRHKQVTSSSYLTSSNENHVTSSSVASSGGLTSPTSRYGFRYNSDSLARDENGNGDSNVHSDEALGKGGVYLPVERGRSYSSAWDENDNEDSTPKQDDSHGRDQDSYNKTFSVNNQGRVNLYGAQHTSSDQHQASTAESKGERAQTISRGRPRQLPVRSQSNPKESSLTSPHTPTRTLQDTSQADRHSPSKTSHLPVPGQSSGIPQRSRDPARQLRRSPRAFDGGPVNPRDSAPAQLASASSPSSGPPQSPRGFASSSLQSPRGLTQGPRGPIANANPATRGLSPSTTPKARSLSAGPAQSPRSSPTGLPHPGYSSAIPQSSRGPVSAIPQSPRGPVQGPPQSPRGSASAIPQSPRGPPPQSPRRLAPGPPHHSTARQGRKGGPPGPMAVMQLAARDLQSPSMHGYLQRKTFNDQWPRYWYVLQDGCLYCYLTPDDRVTVDVTDLEGYTVTSLEDKIPGQRFVIHLDHEDYIPVYLSASSREDTEEWHAALTSAMKATPRANGLGSHGDDSGACGGRVSEERVLSIKQKLLAEVLRQKQELEKKQAARLAHKKQLSQDDSEIGSPPTTPQTPTGEQICTLTRLRQRRMSTQIKMDTLQRQITTNGHKKSRFIFGKKKGSDETPPKHSPDVMEQLKMLSDHLSEIDRDLMQNGGAMTLDRVHARRKMQQQGLRHSYDLESSTLSGMEAQKAWSSSDRKSDEGGKLLSPRSNGVEAVMTDDSGMARSNSLKSSMQKLAHRTFARAGWRGKKSSQGESVDKDSNDSDERSPSARTSGSHDHVTTSDAPDFIDLSNRLARTWPARNPSMDSAGEEQLVGSETLTFLPPPSSFNGDDASPVSSPRSARSTGSMTSGASDQGHHHSNTSHPHRSPDDQQPLYPLKSPRRQVDPGAMANIEAFEELSRQILGEKAS